MMIIGENCKPEIQRIRYKKGQLFASRDLRDDSNIAARLRWLHNRALHDAYGVNYGMTVTRIDEHGNPVDEDVDFVALEISEGLAYDCFGRELILCEPRRISLPSVPPNVKTMTLLIRYRNTATFVKKDAIQGSCIPDQLTPLIEQPEFLWKPESLVELIDGVAIARVSYEGPENLQSLEDKSDSPISRPTAKPRIARGNTIPVSIEELEPWCEEIEDQSRKKLVHLGYMKRIDTSEAGFTEVPCYFASLQDYIAVNGEKFPVSLFLPLFEHVSDFAIDGFTFRVLLPIAILGKFFIRSQSLEAQPNLTLSQLSVTRNAGEPVITSRLYVSWLGIQPETSIGDTD